MAVRSPSPKQILERIQRHRLAVKVRSMQLAKTAVKRQLQAQGLKMHHYSAKEISILAQDYFSAHTMELITKAEEDIATWPGFERWRLPDCAKINSDAQTLEPCSTKTRQSHDNEQ